MSEKLRSSFENPVAQDLISKIKNKESKVCIIGLGYVGFPTAVYFAEAGYEVIGCDVRAEIVNIINNKEPYLSELDLDKIFIDLVSKRDFLQHKIFCKQ